MEPQHSDTPRAVEASAASVPADRARYLVTGGAGFLGINLVRYLLARGCEVASLDIAEFDYADCAENVDIFKGDIRDASAVARAASGCQIVVHCAAALPLYKEADIYSTDVDGTRTVLQVSLDHSVERVVHISSTAVYGIPDHHPLCEDDRLYGVGPYGQAKVMAERVCLDYRDKGLCLPIIRPKSSVGPERLGVFALLYDWASAGRSFPMIGNGSNRYQLLDVEDLCEAIWLCSTLPRERVNDTFNIGAKEFATMREDYQAVLNAAGFGRKVRALPASPVIWTLRLLELLRLSPLYKWVYETASKDSYVSIDRAERLLGFRPRFSNQEALVRNYRWYVEAEPRFRAADGVSHRVPWKQGALRIAKLFF
ncbi:MAG: NAD-dependent epimerase/dehydratase family protein [Phycisphaerales bacterium]|nr:NAD-dependent epimerase/dehydratase family protein [Phycisphaerales bacterium]